MSEAREWKLHIATSRRQFIQESVGKNTENHTGNNVEENTTENVENKSEVTE